MKPTMLRVATALAAVFACHQPASAAVLPFTFNPAAALPALAGPGSTFTANGISVGNYLSAVNQANAAFVVHQYLPITGFTLNGAQVTPLGFGSSYGLYFELTGAGTQPIYNTLDVTLKADPGNLDGLPIATASGVAFANSGATGEADDITLATGSLSSANLAFNPATGVRNGHFVDTFTPAASETSFFLAPTFGSSVLLDIRLTTNPNTYTATSAPNGVNINYVNGAFGTVQFVPEPTSLALLGAALLGLVPRRARTGRAPRIT